MDAWLEVLAVGGPATVQDGGRAGHMHHGVPPGGALVPELLALANRAVGNPWGAAALECAGRLEVRVGGRAARLWAAGRLHRLAPGATLAVPGPPDTLVHYVAVDGGLALAPVLGGCGTLPVAHLGGLEGRALRRGDALPLCGAPSPEAPAPALPGWDAAPGLPVRVLPGPDAPRLGGAALEALLSGTFTVSPLGDRVGRRLAGPRIRHADGAAGGSSPMVRGAIQVPPSGEPIVLGPDHPTLGGYPVLAVVARVDLGRLGARRPGDAVRFQQVDLEDARRSWQALAADFFPPQGACQERGVS